MQATLDAVALKPFTRALTCLSKYGDDLSIYATPDTLSLSATNTSLSAYSRFRYNRQFFVKYAVGDKKSKTGPVADDVEEVRTATGQLLTKSLLSILKHRTVEKTVDRCDLSIVEGADGQDDDEDQDSLESKLIVRLHCKHGIVKTHRLLLLTPTSLMAPGIPDDPNESRLTIGPKAVKDMLDHFPSTKGSKTDPQLIWAFDDSEVQIKSLETSLDARGNAQLSTELTISAEEFDTYDVFNPPISMAFHLREFNATIAYAESMALALDLRFTDPAAPLFIDVEGDSTESLFVVSTSTVPGAPTGQSQARATSTQPRKRAREDDADERAASRAPDRRRPMKVVERTDAAGFARTLVMASRGPSQAPAGSMPPPSLPPPSMARYSQRQASVAASQPIEKEPLFLPSSQMSVADEEALRASGLGIDSMDADEFRAMMEDEGEEVVFGADADEPRARSQSPMPDGEGDGDGDGEIELDRRDGRYDSLELFDDIEIGPTQSDGADDGNKTFRPLFDD